jgi:hypothetical protein
MGCLVVEGDKYKITKEAKHACFSDSSSFMICCKKKFDVKSLGRMLELNVYMFYMLALWISIH